MINKFLNAKFKEYYGRFPLTLVDVGAAGGIQPHWKETEENLYVIGFDPDKRSYAELAEAKNKSRLYLDVGLYKEKGELDLYLTKVKTKSSIFEPNFEFLNQFPKPDRFEVVGKEKIAVDTLDSQLLINGVIDVDFIKADIQGAELFALEGSKNVLANSVFGVEAEVEFAELYKGQPLFCEVDSFLKRFGFWLFDMRPYFWKRKAGLDFGGPKGQLVYGDALYFRSPAGVRSLLLKITDDYARKAKLLKIIYISALYGYVDYALEILKRESGLLSSQERGAVSYALERENNNTLFKRIVRKFSGEPKSKWRVMGKLGNR